MTSNPRCARGPLGRAAWLTVLLLLTWVVPSATAQVPGLTAGETPPAEAPAAPKVVVHHSPRAAMKAFVEAMRRYDFSQSFLQSDLEEGLSALDLRGEEYDLEKGRELAIKLYRTLNRVAVIDYGDYPAGSIEPKCQVKVRDTRGLPSKIRIDFLRIAGGPESSDPENWRIAKTTLAEVESWHETYRERAVVQGLTEITEEDEEHMTLMQWLGLKAENAVPGRLRETVFLIETWKWLALGVVMFLGVVLGRIVAVVLRRLSARLGTSERLHVDKEVLVGFERPFSLFVMGWLVLFARPALRLEQTYAEVLDLACAVFLAVTGVWSAYRLVDVMACVMQDKARRTSNRFDDMLVPLLRRSLKVFITFAGVVYVMSYLSEDLYGIVAGLSIGSLAIGFAAKDSIENLFGTVTVLLDKPYQLGDWVTVGDIDGSVEHVGFRSTKIRTFYNSVITVPNSRFISAHVDNMGARRFRRIKTTLSVAYGTPPERLEAFCEAVRERIRKHPYTRKDYYHVYVNSLGDSAIGILLYCFVMTPDWSTELREKHRLYVDILKVAAGLKVEIAFPTQTIHVAKDEGPLEPLADDIPGAERMGRELADLVVREGLERFEGEKPGPVVID